MAQSLREAVVGSEHDAEQGAGVGLLAAEQPQLGCSTSPRLPVSRGESEVLVRRVGRRVYSFAFRHREHEKRAIIDGRVHAPFACRLLRLGRGDGLGVARARDRGTAVNEST